MEEEAASPDSTAPGGLCHQENISELFSSLLPHHPKMSGK